MPHDLCMQMPDLDIFDLRLLAALQRAGRSPNAALAETVGLSASQVSRRLARLEADGVIAGYAALLRPEAVGLTVMAFYNVWLELHAAVSDARGVGKECVRPWGSRWRAEEKKKKENTN